VFVYPLGEKEVVVSFEAAIAGRLVGVQIQNRGKLKDCCWDCLPWTGCGGPGTGLLWELQTGHAMHQRATSCFGATSGKPDRVLGSEQQCAHAIFTSPAANLAPYELNFQLLVRGACLLAGLESPTHALRADADPSARSASATYITLAQEHPYDRHIEIILHLSEPHSPLVIVERGRLSFGQYERQIRSRRDFIRCARKDPQPERKLEFVRKRYHKDILSSPVLMLNFCPNLLGEPLELNKATRELLFLVDRSGSMSGANIRRVKVTLMQACEYIQRMKADMRGTNLLGVLSWVYQQPVQRSHPRQLFIITDGSISSVAKVLELVRRNTCAGRCFGLGLGPRACRRLLQGVAKLTGGSTEFLDEEERLQPKFIKSLKKAFEPVLTDVRIDWYLPENMEALLSPNDIPPLYPGNRLIGYCILYDTTAFKARRSESQERGYGDVLSGSTGSVFGHSNDELSPPPTSELMPAVTCADGTDLEEAVKEISREISSEFSCAKHTESSPGPGSLPQGLEKMPAPDQRSSLSRWAEPAWQQNLSTPNPEKEAGKMDPRFLRPLWTGTPNTCSQPSPPEDPPPGRCRTRIHGLLSGRPVSWEVTVNLRHLWLPEGQETPDAEGDGGGGEGDRGSWEEIIHHLTARSVIRDFEKMAEKENQSGHGSVRRHRLKAIQTSKHCNIICMYTAFTTTDSTPSKGPQDSSDVRNTETEKQPEPEAPDYLPLVGLQLASGAFLLTESFSDCLQISLDRLKRASPYSLHRRSLSPPFRSTSPSAPSLSSSARPHSHHHVTFSPSARSLVKTAAPPFHHTPDDTPLMLEPRLRRRHRSDRDPVTLSPDPPSSEEGSVELSGSHSQTQIHGQADSGRGSETDVCECASGEAARLQGSSRSALEDPEGSSWATAVALAWLEHRCAGFFMEWELVAAKADFWLRCQQLPEGVDLAGLKGAARQLFLLLRHWDENIQLNMLCYNPNNM
ncbi:unnamed protein product, partial [Lampetra planeri]